MSTESEEEMEVKSTAIRAVLPSSQNSGETVRCKGSQKSRNKWSNGRSVNQGSPRPFRTDRREGGATQYRGQDKRPPPRVAYQSNRREEGRVQHYGTPDTPVLGTGPASKKYGNSLTHLLNFTYTPRERPIPGRGHYHKSSSKKHSFYNKEQFIQANCQFVVGESGDYSVNAMDPDVLVDWNLVEQVCIFSHEVPSCPICLFPPVAAKITRCGHIYCCSCILHYLSLSEKAWHKCPICYESVYQKDLKSVIARETHHFAVGQTITMRLMKRDKNSVLAVPHSQWQERELKPFSINDEVDTRYAKLLVATTEDILQKVVLPEESALAVQLIEAKREQSEELPFIEEALRLIKVRHENLKVTKDAAEEVENILKAVSLENDAEKLSSDVASMTYKLKTPTAIEGVGDYEAAFSDDEEVMDATDQRSKTKSPIHGIVDSDVGAVSMDNGEQGSSDDNTIKINEGATSPPPKSPVSDAKYYFFYQADDGQNIFLHSLNARCLMMEYGSLDNCPDTITGRIVEMEVMSQTEETRKHYHYLGHLPLTCEFVVAELDLKPPLVSRATLEYFRENLHQRKQRRQRKMKMEKKRERKVSRDGATANGRFKSPSGATHGRGRAGAHPNLLSEVDFPSQVGGGLLAMSPPAFPSPSAFMQFAAANFSPDEDCSGGPAADDASRGGGGQDPLGSSPPSFAQALRRGAAVHASNPAKKPSAQCAAKTVPTTGEGSDPEDYVPVPDFQSAFSEALVASDWDRPRDEVATLSDSLPKNEGKKKKGKKKLLFTTGSFMKYN